MNFSSLSAGQQDKVNEVFNNVMSYHGTRFRYSPDQLDRMTCSSNNVRDHVSNGETYFVGSQSGDEECLSVTFLKATFAQAVQSANNGDIICVRGGREHHVAYIEGKFLAGNHFVENITYGRGSCTTSPTVSSACRPAHGGLGDRGIGPARRLFQEVWQCIFCVSIAV